MKLPDSLEWSGSIKYYTQKTGNVSWKSGTLDLKNINNVWCCNVMLSTNKLYPAITFKLIRSNIKRLIFKKRLLLEFSDGLLVHFNPDSHLIPKMTDFFEEYNNDCNAGKKLFNRAEVCATTPLSTKSFNNFSADRMSRLGHGRLENSKLDNSLKVKRKKDSKMVEIATEESPVICLSPPSSTPNGDNLLTRASEKMQNVLSLGKTNFYNKNKSSCGTGAKRMLGAKKCEVTPVKRARLLVDSSSNSQTKSAEKSPVAGTYPLSKLALRGLANMGNTCYLNAILQSLFSLETFATELLFINCKLSKANPSSLHSTMANLLISQTKSESDVSKLTLLGNVREAISTVGTHFLSNDMQDAHECLSQVLDCLKEEGVKLATSTPTSSNNSCSDIEDNEINYKNNLINPTVQNFEFDINRSITCKRCGVVVSKVEQCIDLSLDIPRGGTPSIQDALDLFFLKENVDYRCAKCNHDKAEVSKCISRLPRVFILHLKRYTYNVSASCNWKVAQHISIPKYLTLSPHCSDTIIPAPSINGLFTSPPKIRTETEKDSSLCRRLEYNDSGNSSARNQLFDSSENPDDLGVVPIASIPSQFPNNLQDIHIESHTDQEASKAQDICFFNDLDLDDQTSKLLPDYCSTPGPDNGQESNPVENGAKYLSNDDLLSLNDEERIRLAIENSLQYKSDECDTSPIPLQPDHRQLMFPSDSLNRENTLLPENESNSLTCYDVENKENQQPNLNGRSDSNPSPAVATSPQNGEVNGRSIGTNTPVVDLEMNVRQEEEDLKAAKAMSLNELNKEVQLQPPPTEFGVSVDTLKRSTEEIEMLNTNAVEGNLPHSYQLVSVVAHIGNTSVSGHYLSEVLDLQTNKWYSFDDKEVRLTNETEVQNTRQDSGYIFFYLSKEIANNLRALSANKTAL
ncbi:ubiquitin carboxyl-terminal hydrolase 37-like [Argonauta hians]